MIGAATSVAERYNSGAICATEVAALGGVRSGRAFYATEVASPLFGVVVLAADESYGVAASCVNTFMLPSGVATSVADKLFDRFDCATEVAAPGGGEK
jgi:hypothetical protein